MTVRQNVDLSYFNIEFDEYHKTLNNQNKKKKKKIKDRFYETLFLITLIILLV